MFEGKLIESRGKISDGIRSAIAGIVKHVNSFEKPSCIDCMVIRTMPFDCVFISLIVAIGNDCLITCTSKRFMIDSEIKFAVAHVSNKARHLTSLFCEPVCVLMRLSITVARKYVTS